MEQEGGQDLAGTTATESALFPGVIWKPIASALPHSILPLPSFLPPPEQPYLRWWTSTGLVNLIACEDRQATRSSVVAFTTARKCAVLPECLLRQHNGPTDVAMSQLPGGQKVGQHLFFPKSSEE